MSDLTTIEPSSNTNPPNYRSLLIPSEAWPLFLRMTLPNTSDDNTTPLSAAFIDVLFAALSGRLINNPHYRLPGNDKPFQTTIIVHGGAVFVKLLKSRGTTRDVDYLAAYTDALLEGDGLENSIVFVSKEISAVGKEVGLKSTWMNFAADSIIRQIGDGVVFDGDEQIDVINLIGAQSVRQVVILYEDPDLKIYAMEWSWAFCRKLDRFNDKDKGDIVALLLHLDHSALPTAQKGDIKGAADQLWTWITRSCSLQVADWQVNNREETVKKRILEVAMVFAK